MQKLISFIILNLLLFSQSVMYAKTSNNERFINLQKLLSKDYAKDFDIGYMAITPQFEKGQKSKDNVAIEMFYGEIDDSDQSKKRIEWLKFQLQQDAKIDKNFKTEIMAYGPHGTDVSRDSVAQDFIKSIKLSDTKVKFDTIPENFQISSGMVKTTQVKKPQNRMPASISGRVLWTMIRFSSITGGTSASIYFSTNVDPMIAFSLGVAAGLSSGGITYFSAAYGRFLTNGSWSTWLLESDSLYAKGLRKSFGIDNKSISQLLTKHEKVLIRRHPELAKHPEIFKQRLIEEASQKFSENVEFRKKLVKILSKGDETLKWWVTEVLFTVFSLKIPQSIAGVGTALSATQMLADSLVAGTAGFISQGPVDIALQVRKYQMINELKENINKGLINYPDKVSLIEEIDKVLAKTGPHANYVINDNSHIALKKIENWARSRATILSFFAVMGVAMKVADIPLSTPLLVTLGVSGGFYYLKVKGVFNEGGFIRTKGLQAVDKYSKGLAILKPFYLRYCTNFFTQKV